jgi:hypothetical protein
MVRRAAVSLVNSLTLLVALFAATPSVQWCDETPVPMSPEEFAACLVSEFTGCNAQVECSAASCAAQDPPSSPPSLACEDAVGTTEGASCAGSSCGGDFEERPASGAPRESTGQDRTFCVGNPAGGFGLRPSLDDDSRLLVADLASYPPEGRAPAPERGAHLDDSVAEPVPRPPEGATPIRGPPLA